MYCCVSIFQLISSLPTYPPTNGNLPYNLYLPLPIPFQIIDVLFCTRVWCMPVPLVHQSSYCVCLCKYISTYFFLTHIPTHKWKLNLYLPLPIPFQILFSRNMQYFYYRSTLKSLGVILGGGLNIKVL